MFESVSGELHFTTSDRIVFPVGVYQIEITAQIFGFPSTANTRLYDIEIIDLCATASITASTASEITFKIDDATPASAAITIDNNVSVDKGDPLYCGTYLIVKDDSTIVHVYEDN